MSLHDIFGLTGKIALVTGAGSGLGRAMAEAAAEAGATKGAVVNLTRELALQYADENIQVNAICPGFFVTKLGPYDESEFVKATTNFTPMKRLADPSEIKGAALYLASSASSFVTGACLVIDGGCMAK